MICCAIREKNERVHKIARVRRELNLSTMVAEIFEICWPRMGRNAHKSEYQSEVLFIIEEILCIKIILPLKIKKFRLSKICTEFPDFPDFSRFSLTKNLFPDFSRFALTIGHPDSTYLTAGNKFTLHCNGAPFGIASWPHDS